MLMYFLLAVSNKKPAKSPLRASRTRGHCPIFALPLAWMRVTALSSVLKMQVMSATKKTRITLIFKLSLPFPPSGSLFESAGTTLFFSARISISAKSIINTESIAASAMSI